MLRSRFRRLVGEALESIPPALAERMENVVVLVRSRPSRDELAAADLGHGATLLGLYQGHPLTARGYYGQTLPDRIFIYQESIERICRSEHEMVEQIRTTVLHEVAHHFGIDDDRLAQLGLD